MDFFFYGTLCHPPLLKAVLGHEVATEPAVLAGHAVFWAAGQSFPMIQPLAGGQAAGLLARGLRQEDAARLDYYEGGFAYHDHEVSVGAGGGVLRAHVYLPDPGHWSPGEPWSLADWAARWGEIVTGAAGDFMAGFGHVPCEQMLARYPRLLARAADRLRARAENVPATLRRAPLPGDVEVQEVSQPWARFFAVEEWTLRHRRFDGTMSAPMVREVFVTPDAVTVLPYDPVRDRVLLIEQFRAGPAARGDPAPWQIEAIAGLIDPGESPETCARREAEEEAGIVLGALHHVGSYYTSPGARTESVISYIGIADLPDTAAGLGGLEEEDEDILSHVISFDRLMDLVASGEAGNAPLMLSALWLARVRDRLRSGGGGQYSSEES